MYDVLHLNAFFCSSRCTNRVDAVACLKSTYVSVDKMSCDLCIAGHSCPEDKLDNPVPCTKGTYQNDTGQLTCDPCPAGKGCASTSSTPFDCQNGTYSPEGVSECLACPSGYM